MDKQLFLGNFQLRFLMFSTDMFLHYEEFLAISLISILNMIFLLIYVTFLMSKEVRTEVRDLMSSRIMTQCIVFLVFFLIFYSPNATFLSFMAFDYNTNIRINLLHWTVSNLGTKPVTALWANWTIGTHPSTALSPPAGTGAISTLLTHPDFMYGIGQSQS